MSQHFNPSPSPESDIHPWFNTEAHRHSALGKACKVMDVSIHDREKVYEAMQRVQKEINFKTT